METLTVTRTVSGLSSEQFRGWIEQRHQALEAIAETVAEQVQNFQLEPVTGQRIVAAATAAIHGYEEFYPRSPMLQPVEQLLDLRNNN